MRRTLRRVVYMIPRLLMLPARRAAESFVLRNSDLCEVLGIRVGVFRPRHPPEVLRAKISDALNLIARIDPRTHAFCVQRNLSIVVLQRTRSEYWYSTNTCIISDRLLCEVSDAMAALAIVHEATHARIALAGIAPWPDLVSRIESLCTRAEIRFASRLPHDEFPGANLLIAHLEQKARLFKS